MLTAAALDFAEHRWMPAAPLATVALVLAAVQAALQLGVFMHLRESRGPAWQVIPLALVFLMAAVLVGLSIWIMAFKWGVS